MLSYCLKCRKNNENKNPKVVKTKSARIMLSSNCVVCGKKKYIFNWCHDILMSINLNNSTILSISGDDNCCIIKGISKDDAMKILQNTNLTEKRRVL